MAVRLKDIARDLGLSTMAVSKALRDHPDIGEATKARVRRRAAELDYRVDWVARSMVTGRTFLIGLVVPDLKQSFFADIATALSREVNSAGYHVVIADTGERQEQEREHIEVLLARKVDGLVIASTETSSRHFAALKTPFVLIDRAVGGVEANFVGSCDEELGRIATEHLADQGCVRIAHLSGTDCSPSKARRAGYLSALATRGLEADASLIVRSGYDDEAGYRSMRKLLSRLERPDGVFCFNDPVAIGAMRAIFEAGLDIPKDIAVIGAANMRYTDMLRVPLSTVDQGAAAIGEQAGRLLLSSITQEDRPMPRQIKMPVTLRARASTLRIQMASDTV